MSTRKSQSQSGNSIKKQPTDEGVSELFVKAFDKAKDLLNSSDELDRKLDNAVFPAQKKRLERKKKERDQSFDRLTKYRELTPLIAEYVAQNSGDFEKIADLINFLRQRCSSISMIEDPAIRAHLRRAYGITGERGRKKKT